MNRLRWQSNLPVPQFRAIAASFLCVLLFGCAETTGSVAPINNVSIERLNSAKAAYLERLQFIASGDNFEINTNSDGQEIIQPISKSHPGVWSEFFATSLNNMPVLVTALHCVHDNGPFSLMRKDPVTGAHPFDKVILYHLIPEADLAILLTPYIAPSYFSWNDDPPQVGEIVFGGGIIDISDPAHHIEDISHSKNAFNVGRIIAVKTIMIGTIEAFSVEASNVAFSGNSGMPIMREDGSVAGIFTKRHIYSGHETSMAIFIRARDILALAKLKITMPTK